MEKKSNILLLNKRKRIYNFILENPGFHLREIQRKLNISYSTLRYHLNYLKKRELILTKEEKGYKRYFISKKVGNGDKEIFKIIRDKNLIKILIVFLSCAGKEIFFKKDLRNLPDPHGKYGWYDPWNFIIFKHRTTIAYYLEKLVEVEILEKVKIRKKTGYKITDSEKIIDFLIRYNKEIDDEFITQLINWSNDYHIPSTIDDIIDNIYDIFPNPYHV